MPISLVKLIVEVLEPYGGKILDPACGSGGMFVQSEKFRQRHKRNGDESVRRYRGEELDSVKEDKSLRTLHATSVQDDEAKAKEKEAIRGSNTVLFIDTRNIYWQIDRAHRDFIDRQLDFIANIVRRY